MQANTPCPADRIPEPPGGAEEGTRTLTRLPSPAPQAGVSTNSTTSARRPSRRLVGTANGSVILQAGGVTARTPRFEVAACAMLNGASLGRTGMRFGLWGTASQLLHRLERQLRVPAGRSRASAWALPVSGFLLCCTILVVAGALSGVSAAEYIPTAM